MSDARLNQDPHGGPTKRRERVLEVAIGRELRALRLRQTLTVAELASKSGVSGGMLSKIENGQASPSLTTLQTLAQTLSAPITAFFRGFEQTPPAMHVRAGEGVEIQRTGTRAGHQYALLGHVGSNQSGVIVEPYLITLTTESDTFPAFQHEGMEFLYVLEGAVDYRHGDDVHPLRPGDSLFFDADAPHGPDRLVELPARFLSIIAYPRSGGRDVS